MSPREFSVGRSECKENLPTKENGLYWGSAGQPEAWLLALASLTLPVTVSLAAISSGWASWQLSTALYTPGPSGRMSQSLRWRTL